MGNNEIFTFPKGLPGFENHKRFKLMRDEDDLALAQLISAEDENVGFILLPPKIFFENYFFEVDEDSKKTIGLTESSHQEIWVILTYHSDITKATINLRAPILLNLNNKSGIQLILSDDKYSSRHYLPLNHTDKEGAVK